MPKRSGCFVVKYTFARIFSHILFIKLFDRWNSGILNGEITTFVIATATVAATNATKEVIAGATSVTVVQIGVVSGSATTVSAVAVVIAAASIAAAVIAVVSIAVAAVTVAASIAAAAASTVAVATTVTANRKKVCFPNA